MEGAAIIAQPELILSGVQRSIIGAGLCRVQQRAKKSHYQSKVFVCVSSNRVDAVDRLLILVLFLLSFFRPFIKVKECVIKDHSPNFLVVYGSKGRQM